MTEVGRKILERSLEMLPRAGRMARIGNSWQFGFADGDCEDLLSFGGFCALGMIRFAARSLLGSSPSEEELNVLFPNGGDGRVPAAWTAAPLNPDGWLMIERKFEVWDEEREFASVEDDNERFKLIVEEILLADRSRKETEK